VEVAEQIAKFGAIYIALGGIIAALIGAWSYARFLKRAAHTLLFMKYTERYEQIMSSYPEDAWAARLDMEGEVPAPSKGLTLAALRYLNLCSEEFYLWKRGYIEEGVWNIWEGGNEAHHCQPAVPEGMADAPKGVRVVPGVPPIR
jgi:hypothetical protein